MLLFQRKFGVTFNIVMYPYNNSYLSCTKMNKNYGIIIFFQKKHLNIDLFEYNFIETNNIIKVNVNNFST